MKQGIIFDLDGTLWDSSVQVVESWNEALEQMPDIDRRITTEDMQSWMGLPMDEIGRRMFAGYDMSEEDIQRVTRACELHENDYIRRHGGVLFPHLEEVLADLSKDYFLAIVSNCQVGYIEAFLEYHKLDKYFSDTENFGATGLQKWDNIKLVVERNHLDRAVYMGDIQNDYIATCKAGLPFIHAAYGFGTIDAEVPEVHDLLELRKAVEQVLN